MKNNRLPIRELIQPNPRPDLTPSLALAFHKKQREMVKTYIFTDTIRGYFEKIFDDAARGFGQGFWVQAEYGAGKTHFLVTLAALLANASDKTLWDSMQDELLRQEQQRLSAARLFPVVLSLRGEGSSDQMLQRSLLDVVLEGFQVAIEEEGLDGKIQLTAAQDIINWFESETTELIRSDAMEFIKKKTGKTADVYRDEFGTNDLAKLLAEYLSQANIAPRNIAVGVKDRLAYIYNQLTSPEVGYNGLLIVIDEYEGWEKSHNSPEEKSRDADLLETLGFVLPRDLGLTVLTIVASQSTIPAKLQGSGGGDRFIPLPLLAQSNVRDYDVIISRRSRELNVSRRPEIHDYYRYYSSQFQFAKGLSENDFYDVFPFQPRCFEAIRRITARDLPTARSGLNVFWEVVNNESLTSRPDLIRLSDMVKSPHLVDQCLTKSVYKDAYSAFKTAADAISELGLDNDQVGLANDVLTTLFLWYSANLEQPKPLTIAELVEATLTTQSDDGINATDVVMLVLDAMRQLPQVEFENDSAIFKVADDAGGAPLKAFNDYRRRFLRNPFDLQSALTESLFFTAQDTGGTGGLFSEFQVDTPATKRLISRNLEYTGEVIVASSWRLDHGGSIPKDDTHFRVIILTPTSVSGVQSSAVEDQRIAAIVPGDLTDEIRDAAAAYKAWKSLNDDYANQTGKQADEFKSWLGTQKQKIFGDLVSTHLKLYQSGEIITKENLGISARDAFGLGGTKDNNLNYIVDRLLTSAYTLLPANTQAFRAPLTASDYGKIYDGYFAKDPKPADSSATRSYGVHLNLSNTDKPQQFAPQNIQVFQLLDDLLQEKKGELRIWEIYDKLARPPYGLPYGLIQLYLFAYVRYHFPRIDLTLKPNHKLQTRNQIPITRDRLTSSTIVDLAWKPRIEDRLDALVPGSGPSWQDTLPYAKLLDDRLHSATDQAEIERQAGDLLRALADLKIRVPSLQSTLTSLAGSLNDRLPSVVAGTIQDLAELAEGKYESYADFFETAERIFQNQPDNMRDAMQSLSRLQTLEGFAAEIISNLTYLNQAQPRETSSIVFRNNILNQVKLETLVAGPEIWTRLRSDISEFKSNYRNDYQKFHRDHNNSLAKLQSELASVPTQLQLLDLLNQMTHLGRPIGDDLASSYESLKQTLTTCQVTDVTAVNVEYSPFCDKCGLQMNSSLPNVISLEEDLNSALRSKVQQLASAFAGRQISEQNNMIRPVIEAAQAEDIVTLSNKLDSVIIQEVNKLLKEMGILTIELDLQAELKKNHPSFDEGQLPALLKEVERLVRSTIEKAKTENSDKKTFRITLK